MIYLDAIDGSLSMASGERDHKLPEPLNRENPSSEAIPEAANAQGNRPVGTRRKFRRKSPQGVELRRLRWQIASGPLLLTRPARDAGVQVISEPTGQNPHPVASRRRQGPPRPC
jgi:hypothetical protein